jgi:putrescine transport system ATP-binding protein
MAFLEIQGVGKRFGATPALDRCDLAIERGEFFALLGASGCGKSTLLRCLAGLEQPDEGRILLDGQDLAGVPPYARPVNMMFQSYALFPHMDVAGNIAFGLRQDGLPRAQIATRVAEMLALVRLEGFETRRPAQLSGGQRARVALARALARGPKLLLLDEPLSALDKTLREAMRFELATIQRETGTTFVIVTHDQEEALAMATRLAVMDRGRIRQVGTPGEVYEFPNSRFIAGFIGSANILEGRVDASGPDGARIACAGLGTVVTDRPAPDGRVFVAIRPERLRVLPAAEAPAENAAIGTLREVAYQGDAFLLHVTLADGTEIRVSHPNLRRVTGRPAEWDGPVAIAWERDAPVLLAE